MKPRRSRISQVPSGTRAVVLAGGKGTRLLPYTTLLPKPLVPVGEHPILEHALRLIQRAGFERITLCVGHLSELIRAYFGDGKKWKVRLDYSVEDKPLSTIGPLAFVRDLGENFLVMNGDILTDLNPAELFFAHQKSGADLTVATYRREVKIDYGILKYDAKSRRIRAFSEKPSLPYDVSMGIYVLNRRCLDLVERGKPMGFDALVLELLRRRRPVMAYPYQGRWLDIGRPEDYALAQAWADGPPVTRPDRINPA
jgi:NDP-sugar pyrophosphorylase family protein